MIKKFLISTILVVSAAVTFEIFLENGMLSRSRADERIAVYNQVSLIRADMEKEVVETISCIHGIVNLITAVKDVSPDQLRNYVKGLFTSDGLLLNVSISRGFVVTYVYPEEGTQNLIGLDYRRQQTLWPLVEKAYITGKMVIAGPLDLPVGGRRGIIARLPVFTDFDGRREFWGMVSLVLDTDRLFSRLTHESKNIEVALRGVDGKGEQGGMILGDKQLFSPEANAVKVSVRFSHGDWVLAAIPKGGWGTGPPFAMEIRFIVLAFLAAILFLIYRGIRKSHTHIRTKESLNEAQAIAHLGSWELNMEDGSLWWSDEVYRLHGMDKETFTPSFEATMGQIHPEDRADVYDVLELVRTQPIRYSVEYRIIRPDGSTINVLTQGRGEYDAAGTLVKLIGTVLDVTKQTIAQENLQKEQAKIKAMAEASYDALAMVNDHGRIVFWSPAAERMFGWTEEEALGTEIHDLIAPEEYHKDAKAGIKQFATTGTGPVMESIMEFNAIRKDGSTLPVERSVSCFKLDDKYFAVGILRDITERKRFLEQLQQLARTDKMTGLFNRSYFTELAEQAIQRANRYGHPLSLIMFDADKFKRVNDTYGHAAGDKVLVNIAETVDDSIRQIDLLGRIGGEEFAVVLMETDLEAAKIVAEKIRSQIEAQRVSLDDGSVISYTVSLGIALHSRATQTFEELLKAADLALYQAKANGRNRWEVAR